MCVLYMYSLETFHMYLNYNIPACIVMLYPTLNNSMLYYSKHINMYLNV